MSKHATHPCTKCHRPASLSFTSGGLDSHTAHEVGHQAAHNAMHGSPLIAVLWLGAAAVKALMPKKYYCRSCDHEFTA